MKCDIYNIGDLITFCFPLHVAMSLCKVVQKKLIGNMVTSAFYTIENNCIVVFYYKGQTKVEYFYNLSDLQVERRAGCTTYVDGKKKLRFELPQQVEMDSSVYRSRMEEDYYFDFEPSAYRSYAEEDKSFETPSSFVCQATLRHFEE